jgi:hypothetical protein
MATVSGGMPQAAAAEAAAAAAGVQESRLAENFYRFQQREQRRTGEQVAWQADALLHFTETMAAEDAGVADTRLVRLPAVTLHLLLGAAG